MKKNHNYKFLLGVVVGLILSSTLVYAVTIGSNQVSYDNTKSGMKATTMQGALDELYEKTTKRTCKVVEGNKTTIGSTVNCEGENFYIAVKGSTIALIAKYGLNSSYVQSTTPTPVNYSDATKWIENYVKTTLSGIKGNISFYGHSTEETVRELAESTHTSGSLRTYIGEKLRIGGTDACGKTVWGYWTDASHAFAYYCGPGGYYSHSISNNTTTNYSFGDSRGSIDLYARPMIKVPASIIIDL